MLSFFKRNTNKNKKNKNKNKCKFNEAAQVKYNINITINNNYCTQSLLDRFFHLNEGRFYSLVKTIYEKPKKGTYIIISTSTYKKFILKIKEKSKINFFEEDIFAILNKNKNNNIATFISLLTDNDYYYFIYEYVEGYNLLEYIKKYGQLNEIDIKSIMKQIVNGIEFLHQNNILHCDMKLENIIINDKKEIKIIDFDLSIVCDNDEGYISNNVFGTLQYIAPESYDLCIYSKKTDVWQLGVILYVLITNKFPHDDKEITIVNSYSNLCRQNIFKHIDLSIPKNIIIKKKLNMSMYYLLEHMLNFNDKCRATLDEIKNSVWLNATY